MYLLIRKIHPSYYKYPYKLLCLQKINNFLRTSDQYEQFKDTVDFIDSLLTPEQKQILEIQYKGETIDFKSQLFLTLANRYENRDGDVEELKARSTKALNKYSFLFETNLSPLQIRTILLRELSEAISFGFLCSDKLSDSSHRQISKLIKEKYPNLPPRKQGKKLIYFWEECFDFIHQLFFMDLNITKLGYSEFFKKTKGYFEQLNSCEPEYIDKYRERIYKETRFAMGIWHNEHLAYSHEDTEGFYNRLLYISKVRTNTNKHLQEAVEEVLSYFSEEELAKLERIDSTGQVWNFKNQLIDRYYSKYPSFVPLEEIKLEIKKIVEQYKPLFGIKDKKEVVKELFLDELEIGIFVSEDTHFWNQVMFKNLDVPKTALYKGSYTVNLEIQKILDLFEPENEKDFYLEIEGQKHDLKTFIISRGGHTARERLLGREIAFKNKFFAVVYLEILKNKNVSKTDMQAFLEKLDFFFLTPKFGISQKKYREYQNLEGYGFPIISVLAVCIFACIHVFFD